MNIGRDRRNFFKVSAVGYNSVAVSEGRIIFFNPLSFKVPTDPPPAERDWEETVDEAIVSAPSDFEEITKDSKIFLKISTGGSIVNSAYLFDFGTGENIPHPDFVGGEQVMALAKRYGTPGGEIVIYTPDPDDPTDNQISPPNVEGETHILIAEIDVDIDDDKITNIVQRHLGPVFWMPFDIIYGDGHIPFFS